MKLSQIFLADFFLGGSALIRFILHSGKYSILNMCRFYYVKFIGKLKNINSAFPWIFLADDDTW